MIQQSLCLNSSQLIADFLLLNLLKVNWTGDVNLDDLAQGKLPDVQVPTHVHDEHFYQVSYQDQSVSVSFNIV